MHEQNRHANGRPSARLSILFAVTVLAACGCQTAEDPPAANTDNSLGRAASSSDGLLISKAAFEYAFLLVDDGRVRWRFDADRFVVESWQQPLPKSIRHVCLEHADQPVYRIAGRWQLSSNGRQMTLDQLSSDHAPTKTSALLELAESPRGLQLGEIEYELADHPGTPEEYPDDVFWARCSKIIRGDLLLLSTDEGTEEIHIAAISCPAPNTPDGQAAIARCRELIQDQPLLIKVFDRRGAAPRHAQMVTRDLIWINLEMLRHGHAWHDKTTDREWQFALKEDAARLRGEGIWQQNTELPPWLETSK